MVAIREEPKVAASACCLEDSNGIPNISENVSKIEVQQEGSIGQVQKVWIREPIYDLHLLQ